MHKMSTTRSTFLKTSDEEHHKTGQFVVMKLINLQDIPLKLMKFGAQARLMMKKKKKNQVAPVVEEDHHGIFARGIRPCLMNPAYRC